jgi:trk system potassium uptake protein TrkH
MKIYSSFRIERMIVFGFLAVILAGTFALWFGNMPYRRVPLLDCLFTATSAVCVTGLSTLDTGTDFSQASQIVILVLIQLGGLGVMTATTALLYAFRRRIGIRQRMLFSGGLGLDSPSGAVRLAKKVVLITVFIEAMGAIPMFFAFRSSFPGPRSLYLAVFHSVSAFCNAGFSPFSDSLQRFSGTVTIPLTVMTLILLGGAGFLVIDDIRNSLLHRGGRLSAHSRLVVAVSALLVVGGALAVCVSDWNGALAGHSWRWKLWNALFHSVSPRTAGFNTIPMDRLTSLGAFFTILLMIIGASPGSTGGGIKTTSFALLMLSTAREIRGRDELVVGNRSVGRENVSLAFTLAVLYTLTILIGITVLAVLETHPFRALAFEVASALGTVGLSLGITSSLSPAGKVMIVLLMFWGRVGILTFMYGIAAREAPSRVSYAETHIPVG